MLNINFLACTKVELRDLTFCIAVNGEKFQSCAVTFTLIRPCPISHLFELFSYTTMYLNFMFLNQFLFKLWCKKHTYMETQIWMHTKTIVARIFSIVALCTNATTIMRLSVYTKSCYLLWEDIVNRMYCHVLAIQYIFRNDGKRQ